MESLTIGEYLIQNNLLDDIKTQHSYHRKIYFPEWFEESYSSFKHQVMDMCRKRKPFKATDTFKIQAGYPYEVEKEHKDKLINRGIKRDTIGTKHDIQIPKLDVESFYYIMQKGDNPISFNVPKNTKYIKDITVYDNESHEDYTFIYVISRRAQVITAWIEPKKKGKYVIPIPNDRLKKSLYETG